MSIPITDKFKPRNNGGFPLVDAVDVEMPDGTRLSDFKGGGTITVDAALDPNSTNPVQNKVICEQLAKAGLVLQQLQSSIPAIDNTLSNAGQAADAGAVGAVLQEAQQTLQQIAGAIPTEAQINALIDAKLGVIENGTY